MSPRTNPATSQIGAKVGKYIFSAAKAIFDNTTVPMSTIHLVLLRASQINGCGYCCDVHTKDAVRDGESHDRLHLVAGWREAKVFTEAERAALELTEEGTRIADGATGVPDEVWANAAKHYDDEELTALMWSIAIINANNRFGVMNKMAGGDYVAGTYA